VLFIEHEMRSHFNV